MLLKPITVLFIRVTKDTLKHYNGLTTVSVIGCGSTGRLLSNGSVKSFPSLYISINCTRSSMEEYTALRRLSDIREATEEKK